jgi:hypothetical protein
MSHDRPRGPNLTTRAFLSNPCLFLRNYSSCQVTIVHTISSCREIRNRSLGKSLFLLSGLLFFAAVKLLSQKLLLNSTSLVLSLSWYKRMKCDCWLLQGSTKPLVIFLLGSFRRQRDTNGDSGNRKGRICMPVFIDVGVV